MCRARRSACVPAGRAVAPPAAGATPVSIPVVYRPCPRRAAVAQPLAGVTTRRALPAAPGSSSPRGASSQAPPPPRAAHASAARWVAARRRAAAPRARSRAAEIARPPPSGRWSSSPRSGWSRVARAHRAGHPFAGYTPCVPPRAPRPRPAPVPAPASPPVPPPPSPPPSPPPPPATHSEHIASHLRAPPRAPPPGGRRRVRPPPRWRRCRGSAACRRAGSVP
mmetsp:Transcript_15061/g.35718  ORF Transcript_15061/g.35718 Transcript_15061/m.35718 type:complete len:223 (-) Transcript_15061:215-883(-)